MEQQMIGCVIGDDHAMLRSGLSEYLRCTEGIRIVGSGRDGRATLELVMRRHPEVLVVDAVMPDMSGVEVCAAVRQQRPETAVIMYTGRDDVSLLEDALEAGAAGFVLKSGSPDAVARAILTVAEGGTYIDPALGGALLARRARRALLSARECEVLTLLADGQTTAEAARQLYLSPATVRTYAENAMHKVEARNRPHLVAKSMRMGLIN